MGAQPPPFPFSGGATSLSADELSLDNLIAIINSGPQTAVATLAAIFTFFNGKIIEAPIINGVVTIDLSLAPGGLFWTTITGNFAIDVINEIDDCANGFVYQTIGNGVSFTGDFSFAKFPGAGSPIYTSASGAVDTYTFIERASWWGFISGQNSGP